MKTVRQLDIHDIYTYRTSLNSFFLNAVPGIGRPEYLPKQDIVPPFHVHYIKRLDEVTDGWIAIPGINRLDPAVTSDTDDDLVNDPVLNLLTKTRQMDNIAEAKFKTYCTSIIWLSEDDITSYCVLYLKDIGPDDLYRGHAWLMHSSKLKPAINT